MKLWYTRWHRCVKKRAVKNKFDSNINLNIFSKSLFHSSNIASTLFNKLPKQFLCSITSLGHQLWRHHDFLCDVMRSFSAHNNFDLWILDHDFSTEKKSLFELEANVPFVTQ